MRIHHLGWVVRDAALHRDHFERELGLPFSGEELFPSLKVVFYDAGNCWIELLEPLPGANDDVTQRLSEHGEGIHHIAYEVADVAVALREAVERGLVPIDQEPRPGARGTSIAFVDPGREDGILVEYVQEPLATA